MDTIKNATNAIIHASFKNCFITSDLLRQEAIDGSIDGWLSLPEISACNLSEWTAAMFAAAFQLDLQKEILK